MSGIAQRGAARAAASDVRGGLPGAVLEHPAGGRVEVALHGAHLLSWTRPDGDDVLFLSRRAVLDGCAAIRGGVPVIFPQFGPGPLPKHGFARTARWSLDALDAGETAASARLSLADDERTRAIWPHEFGLELALSLGEELSMRLTVTNRGRSPLSFTAALHGYLRVAEIGGARLGGLRGTTYVDQLRGGERRVETARALLVDAPVDRIYVAAPTPLRLDERGGRAVAIAQDGFTDTVVWNPWSSGAAALSDMADDEYRSMLCVEAAVAAAPVRLAAGERWIGTQRLRVDSTI